MGLDVSLYRYRNLAKTLQLEKEYENRSALIWKEGDGRKYEDIPDAEKEANRAALKVVADELGLDEYGSAGDSMREAIELPSATYPDHLFKIGYLRSSYNDGGINRLLDIAVGRDLYWVFGREREGAYHFVPDWQAARERAATLRADWVAHAETDGWTL
jgi:hypothetical protein